MTVAAVVVTAGAAAAAGGAAAAGTATGTAVEGTIATGTVIAADAATDVAATAYTANKINKLSKMAKVAEKAKVAKQYIDDFNENIDTVKQYDQSLGQKSGMNRGIIETSVGWVTEFSQNRHDNVPLTIILMVLLFQSFGYKYNQYQVIFFVKLRLFFVRKLQIVVAIFVLIFSL